MPTETTSRLLGVLLAAGRGRRMGGAKQFQPWPTSQGSQPLVAASFDAVCGVCADMIVVLGHRAAEVTDLLAGRSFHSVKSDPDGPMFQSICAGLRAAGELDAGATVVLHPGDHPEVAGATLKSIVAVSRSDNRRAVLPEYRGRGGHPVLIPPVVIERVLAAECPDGLREFWRDYPELCTRIDVDDPSVIRDVDTYP